MGGGRQSRHLRWAAVLFLLDSILVWLSFSIGVGIRFKALSLDKLIEYGPGVSVASMVFPAILYIGGLYSPRPLTRNWFADFQWITLALVAVFAIALAVGSLDFSSRVGRGVLIAAMAILAIAISVRHLLVVQRRRRRIDSLFCLVKGSDDEEAAARHYQFWGERAKTFGLVSAGPYKPDSSLPYLGEIGDLSKTMADKSVDVVLVRDRHFSDANIAGFLRSLRYAGADILPISYACEDA